MVAIPGNHEYWGLCINEVQTVIDTITKSLVSRGASNVSILNCDSLIIDDIAFVGATLWSKINIADEFFIQQEINDYQKIFVRSENKNRYIYTYDTSELHNRHVQYITEESARLKGAGYKVLVISHHSPTLRSIPEMFFGHRANSAYSTDLDYLLENGNIYYWMYGHHHTAFNTTVGNCQVICNPVGYPRQDTGFVEDFLLEV